jgi:prepilin-type N-terminal cleavage/methylation domain-containing protein
MGAGMSPSLRRHLRSQRGMTMIEILISMIILACLTAMLIAVWVDLQRASSMAITANDERGSARDALDRISSELRDAQPIVLHTETPSPSPMAAGFTVASRWEADFYSAYNSPSVAPNGVDMSSVRLTRIYLDTSGSTPYKTLYWQRDDNNDGVWNAGDRKVVMATNVVNPSITDASQTPVTSYTSLFYYWCVTSIGAYTLTAPADSVATSDLNLISAVRVRIIQDNNLNRPPVPVDLTATVRVRNHN